MRLRWPTQITPYRSALPGVGAPGLDISAPELPTKFYFITNFNDNTTGAADSSKGPNCFSGSARYCWNALQGAGFHKVIVPLIGGYAYIGRKVTAGNLTPLSNMDYIGHAAPGPGLIYRCCNLRAALGDNARIWHCASWMGDEPGLVTINADNRDCLACGYPQVVSSRHAFINCEARLTMDEAAELGYNGIDGVSWIRGACYDPLHVPPDYTVPGDIHHGPGIDHGFGMLIGGTHDPAPPALSTVWADHSFTLQSVFAHTTGRNPLHGSVNHSHINNLHYNHGRLNPGGRGAGIDIFDNQSVLAELGKTMQTNIVGNLTVLGPEQVPTKTQRPVLAAITLMSPGSTAHIALNAQVGWVPVTSQADFFENPPPAGFLQPTLCFPAWYTGCGDNYQGVLRAFQNPLKPQAQEALEFSRLCRETTGMMPRRRYLYKGALNRVFDQIDDAIRGVPNTWQYINRVSDLPANGVDGTGWEVIPTPPMIDPLNPTADWHAPMPLDATRDDILTTGFFSNGFSKMGYTKWRAWVIEQNLYVMGP